MGRNSYNQLFSDISNNSSSSSSSLSFKTKRMFQLLKKPHAFPFLLFIFILLTWLSLTVQHHQSQRSKSMISHDDDDAAANLVRFSSSQISKDHRGWILNPISLALDQQHSISGGAVTCASVHVGEIRAGGGLIRGNHRHRTCNETFVIWGATTIFRLQNSDIVDKGYAEVVIGADEVAVAASPIGTAHALVNIDPFRTTYFMGCQDGIINYNTSTTDFNVWNDLL